MTTPQITIIAAFLRISFDRAYQIPYDLLLAIEAARVRQEQAVQAAQQTEVQG